METQIPINPYAQPVLFAQGEVVPPAVLVNQQVWVVDPKSYKTTPIALTCTFCNKPMTTHVDTKCSCLGCLFCFFCPGIYICRQCFKGKDLWCYDAKHSCPHCRNVVGTYTSC